MHNELLLFLLEGLQKTHNSADTSEELKEASKSLEFLLKELGILEPVESFATKANSFKDLLCEGFIIPPTHDEYLLLELLLYYFCTPNVTSEDIVLTIVNFFDRDNFTYLDQMINDWFKSDYIKTRERFIYTAVDRYKNGDYLSAILCLATQFESIITTQDTSDKNIKAISKKLYHFFNNKKYKHHNFNYIIITYEVISKFIEENFAKTIYPDQFGTIPEDKLSTLISRNLIFHGVNYAYDTKDNCIRLFLFMDSVLSMVEKDLVEIEDLWEDEDK